MSGLLDRPTARAAVAAGPRACPVTFATCFGWLHPAEADSPRCGVGIVLCAPLSQDLRATHRPWAEFADALAAQGYPTLRFDYPDTGDSWTEECLVEDRLAADVDGSGLDLPGPDRLPDWIAGIEAAASWMRDIAGRERVILCGVQLGAALATLARVDADGLVLIDPVVKGRAHVRELKAMGLVAARLIPPPADGVEAGSLRLSGATVRSIGAIDLAQANSEPTPTLVMGGTHTRLIETWGADRPVATAPFDASLPLAASAPAIAAWLTGIGVAARPLPALPIAALRPPGAREQPWLFGEGRALFGMLCRPRGDLASDAASDAAVIICNSGSNPHHGHGRQSVTLARRLAQTGIASLRIDFSGLGDSASCPAGANPHLFDVPRVSEIRAAIDLLENQGFRRFMVAGVCAGAYHAMQAAQVDPRISALYLVNMPAFRWRKGEDPDLVMLRAMHATNYYVAAMRSGMVWLRLLRGEVNLRRIAQALFERVRRRARVALALPLSLCLGTPASLGLPWHVMRRLGRSGVRSVLLYGIDDPGLEEIETYFGRRGRLARRFAGMSVDVLSTIDHAVSFEEARKVLTRHMVATARAFVAGTL